MLTTALSTSTSTGRWKLYLPIVVPSLNKEFPVLQADGSWTGLGRFSVGFHQMQGRSGAQLSIFVYLKETKLLWKEEKSSYFKGSQNQLGEGGEAHQDV